MKKSKNQKVRLVPSTGNYKFTEGNLEIVSTQPITSRITGAGSWFSVYDRRGELVRVFVPSK